MVLCSTLLQRSCPLHVVPLQAGLSSSVEKGTGFGICLFGLQNSVMPSGIITLIFSVNYHRISNAPITLVSKLQIQKLGPCIQLDHKVTLLFTIAKLSLCAQNTHILLGLFSSLHYQRMTFAKRGVLHCAPKTVWLRPTLISRREFHSCALVIENALLHALQSLNLPSISFGIPMRAAALANVLYYKVWLLPKRA